TVKDYNLFLGGADGEGVPLTKDGVEDHAYAIETGPFAYGPGGIQGPSPWSKDSEHFYAYRRDARGVKELFVIDSLATPRPTLEKYKYPMPGEEEIRRPELYVYNAATKALTKVPS